MDGPLSRPHHLVGRRQRFRQRGRIEIERSGRAGDYLLAGDWIPAHLQKLRIADGGPAGRDRRRVRHAQGVAEVRLHGDCHRGNVLWTDDGPHFVDLDDCVTGPAMQDLWMLLSGTRAR